MTRRRRRRASRRGGIALILTLLVLAILIVLTVQLAFSVKIEQRVVANTEDDAAFELAGARGAPVLLAALFRDDRKNGLPNGAPDTDVDIWCDPKTPEARQLTIGDATLTVEVEDLERRIPLAWLTDQDRAPIVEKWLTRLITKLAPVQGDPAAVAKQIAERVRSIEGVELAAPAPGGAPPASTATAPPAAAKTRHFVNLTQLLDAGAAPSTDGSTPPPAGTEAGGDPAAGLDRRFLYGDPEADPPTQGIAGFVTTWPIAGINLNTAYPEVLFAILPEKNKGDEGMWDDADAIVEGIQRFRIDPDYQTKQGTDASTDTPAPGASTEAPGGKQGASRQWAGTAFAKVDELQNAAIHAKLGQIFTKATPSGGGIGGTTTSGAPPPTTTTGGPPPADSALELKALLTTESHFYAVRAKVRRTGGGADVSAPSPDAGEGGTEGPEGVYRLVIVRDAQDVVTVLQVVEGSSP